MSGVTGHRVAFDVTMARTNMMGTGAYTRHLAEALRPLMGPRLRPIDCAFARPFTHRKTARDRVSTLAHDVWWTQVGTLNAANEHDAKLLHIPSMLAPVRGSIRVIVTIHDLAIVRFPQKFRAWHRTWTSWLLPRVIRKADAVVAVSQATRNDIVQLLGVAPERITVIPCGINGEFSSPIDEARLQRVRERYDLPGEFLISVGAIEPRKNLVRLLQAIKLLVESEPRFRDLTLVHAGPVGWHAADVPRAVAELRLERHVRFLGFVPDDDLAALYRLARASVYPSLFEGFGLPVLESMASGCPVVTSDCSSLPEVAGDAAVLVDPTSVEAIADGIRRVWDDEDLRRCLIDRARRRAATFTWDAAARATVELYDRVLASGFSDA
jgi:glycosyltransferase involved in cell wall biosynthesis